jgi:hypothetical protein
VDVEDSAKRDLPDIDLNSAQVTLPQFPVKVEEGPVGGWLAKYWENWEAIEADPYVVQILLKGYKWEFVQKPVLSKVPIDFSRPKNSEICLAMEEQIDKLLRIEAVELVQDISTPGYYSRFFIVPKKEPGKWRAILDLSVLNQQVEKEKFKMETAESIRGYLSQGDWATSLDLTDAYRHIMIHPQFRKYLRFVFQNKVYQYRSLPMGITTAPRIFTRIIKCIKGFLQKQSVKLHQYLDDWLIHAKSREVVLYHTHKVVELAQSLGWKVNMDKSDLTPSQDCTYLSYRFRMDIGIVCPVEERWDKIQRKVEPFLRQEAVVAGQWQSLLGVLTATEKLVPLGMLHIRPIQMGLLSQWSTWHGDQRDQVSVSEDVKKAITWWTVRQNVMEGVSLTVVKPAYHVFTDASMKGWGGHMEEWIVQGRWSTSQQKLHINVLELIAVWNVLKEFVEILEGQTVMVASDNTMTVAYIRKQGGTRSPELLVVTQQLYKWLSSHQITIKCHHIPGKLNILADSLSREGEIIPTEWSIHPQVLQVLWTVLDRPLIGMMATRYNRKMEVYVSPIPDVQAYAVDAISLDWKNMYMYLFPPTAMVSKVLEKARGESCTMVLIAPAWPRQRWYPELLELLIDYPIKLPDWEKLLKQPRSDLFHQNPAVYHLHAWKLSSEHTKVEDFQRVLHFEWQERRRSRVSQCTKENGESSVIGVRNGLPIHAKQMPSW